MGNRQQSRFLALVSNGDRLAELSAAAADSQDAATLQILKTMDSIEFKSQQLQTSLQTLYTESGIQDMYKNVLDFAKVIIDSFTSMPKPMNMPIAALVRFGMAFKDLANIVISVVNFAQNKILAQHESLRTKITRIEQAITEMMEEENQKRVQNSQKANSKMSSDQDKKLGLSRLRSGASLGLSVGSLVLGGLATNAKSKNDKQSQQAGGILSTLGSAASFAATGMSIGGGAGALIGGALGAVTGFLSNLDLIFDSLDNRLKRTTAVAEERRNEALQAKSEEKQLVSSIDKLKELEKHQHDSTEAYNEYIQAMSELAGKYPDLISSYTDAGDAIVKVEDAEKKLIDVRKNTVEATRKATVAEYAKAIAQKDQADKKAQEDKVRQYREYAKGLVPEGEKGPSITVDGKTLTVDLRSYSLADFFSSLNEQRFHLGINISDILGINNDELTALSESILGAEVVTPEVLEENKAIIEKIKRTKNDISQYFLQMIDPEIVDKLNKDYTANLTRNEEGLARSLKAQLSNYAVASLNEYTESVVKELSGVTDIVTSELLKSFSGDENDLSVFYEESAGKIVSDTVKKLDAVWKELDTDSKRNKFSELIENAGKYSQKEFNIKLEELIQNKTQEVQNALELIIDSIFTKDTFDFLNFTNAISARAKNNLNSLSSTVVSNLGSDDYKIILDMFDTISGYSDKSLSKNRAQKLYSTYENLWNYSTVNGISNDEKEAIQEVLSKVNDLSTNSIGKLIKDLEDLGFTSEEYQLVHDTAQELFSIIPKNLNTEIETYRQSISDTASDYEKALSNASKGMDFKTATELATKLKINLSDFTLENGKFYTDNYQQIRDAYYAELEVQKGQIEALITSSKENAKQVLESVNTSKDLEDISDVTLGDLNLNRKDLEDIIKKENYTEKRDSIIEEFYDKQQAELNVASDYLQQQLDSISISGNLVSFLESHSTNTSEDNINVAVKDIIAGNVPKELSEFGATLIQLYGNTAKNTYEAAIKALGGESQTIQVTAANRKLLEELGFKGAGTELRIGETAYLQGAKNSSNLANEIQNSINNSYLNKEDQEKLLNSIVTAQQELYNGVESLIGKQSSGFKSAQDIQTYLNSLTTIYKDYTVTLGERQINIGELNFADSYTFDRNLNAYVLQGDALIAQMAILREKIRNTFAEGTNEYKAAMGSIQQNVNTLANSINIKDFLDAEDNTVGSIAAEKLEKSISDYNAAIQIFAKDLGELPVTIIADSLMEYLRKGGVSGVNAAKEIARIQGKTLSKSEIESIYRKPVTEITNTIEAINKGVGTILNAEELALLGIRDQLPTDRVFDIDGLVIQRIGKSDDWVITGAENLAEAHKRLYEQLSNTSTATTEEINKIAAQYFTDLDNNKTKATNAVKNALDMTYEEFGKLLQDAGYVMSESLIAELSNFGIINQLGNGNLRIDNFLDLAEFLNLDTTSEAFTSAFKTYNDGLITLNNRAEKAIAAEIKNVIDAKPGDWINLTELENEFKKLGEAAHLRLLAILQAYGGELENGILKIDENANILNLANALSGVVNEHSLILERDFNELTDAIDNLLTSLVSSINAGIKGTLSKADARSLKETAEKTFGIKDISFQQTSEGLRLSNESAQELYLAIKQVDAIQGNLIFKELRTSLESANGDCRNISTTLANIKRLQDDINKASGNEVGVLKQRLSMYQDIARAQMSTAEQYDFMGRKLPSGMQGPLNYWDSIGKMFKTINEAIYGEKGSKNKKKKNQKGYIGVQDFYNIVTELNNMAAISGTSITFLGQKLDGDLETAANLIQKGFGALANVKGEGTKIALSKLGKSLGVGTDVLLKDVEGGVKGMAEANIKMLDAQIQMLEGIVALEQLGEIDLNGNGIFDLSDVFKTDKKGNIDTSAFNATFDAARKAIMDANAKNEDFQKALDTFYVNSVSLRDLLTKSADQLAKAGLSSDTIVKIYGAIAKAAKEGRLELDGSNLTQILTEAIGTDGVITLNNSEFTISVGSNGFVIDYSQISSEDLKKATGKTVDDLKKIVDQWNKDPKKVTLDESVTLYYALKKIEIKEDPNGEKQYIVGDKIYTTPEEATAAAVFSDAGWDSKEEITINKNIATTVQAYGPLNVQLTYDANTKKVTYKSGTIEKDSLDDLIAEIEHIDKNDAEAMHRAKIKYDIDLVGNITVDQKQYDKATQNAINQARELVKNREIKKGDLELFKKIGIKFDYVEISDEKPLQIANKTYNELTNLFDPNPKIDTFTEQIEGVGKVIQDLGETDLGAIAESLASIAKSFETIAGSNLEKILQVFEIIQQSSNNGIEGQAVPDTSNLVSNLDSAITKIKETFDNFSSSTDEAKNKVDTILEAIEKLDLDIKLTVNRDDIIRQVARLSLPSKTIKLYADVNDILTKINNLPKSISVKVDASTATTPTSTVNSLTSQAAFSTLTGQSQAKGTLMGELGPELYVTGGRYYLAGQNGAEFVDLPDDAIVFNHLQTKKLFNGENAGHGSPVVSEQRSTSYATGNVNGGNALASASEALASLKQIRAMWQAMIDASMKDLGSQAGRSGGGGKNDPSKTNAGFIADLERWYNLLRQIAKLEEKISYEQKLQAKITSDTVNRNGSALYSSYKRELEYLDQEIAKNMELSDLQKSYYEARRKDLADSEFGKIFTFNEEGLMQYNDNAILANGQRGGLFALAELNSQNADGSTRYSAEEQYNLLKGWGFETAMKYDNTGKEIVLDEDSKNADDYYTKSVQAFWDKVDGWKDELDELYDSYNSKLEDILDNEASRNKILQAIIDNQLSVEDSVVKAIEDREQAIIDALQDERDTVEKNNQKFLEGLNEQLNRERDMYQRQQENDELISLRRQLAILQRSGGSASQIRNLQEQINTQEREKYFNTQQDQIDAIEKASNVQIERLDAQIELMTETLEYQKEHGLLWNEVYEIMNKSESEIADFIMSNGKEWMAKSSLQIDNDLNTLRGEIGQWIAYRKDQDKKSGDMTNSWNNYTAGVSNRYSSVWTPENVAAAMAAFNAEYNQSADPNRAAEAANAIFESKLSKYMASQPSVPQEYKAAASSSNSSGGSGSGGGSGGSSSSSGSSSGKTTTTVAEIPAPTASSGGLYTVSYYIPSTKRTVTKQFNTAAEAQEYRNKIIQSAQYQSRQIEGAAYNAPSSTTSSTSTTTGGTHGYKITQYGKVVQESGPRYATREAAQAAAKAIVAKLPGGKYTTYDRGGMVDEDQLALVHAGEAVLTANQTETLRNAVLNTHNKSSVISLLMNWRDSMERVINNATDGVSADGITIENATVEMNVGSIANDYDARRAGSEALNEMLRIARQTKVQSVRR